VLAVGGGGQGHHSGFPSSSRGLKTSNGVTGTSSTYDRHRERMEAVLSERVPQYAAATLVAVTALVEGADPVAAIRSRLDGPVATLPAFTPPGVVSVGVEAEQLHAECLRKRRPPAATTRKGGHHPEGQGEGGHWDPGRRRAQHSAWHPAGKAPGRSPRTCIGLCGTVLRDGLAPHHRLGGLAGLRLVVDQPRPLPYGGPLPFCRTVRGPGRRVLRQIHRPTDEVDDRPGPRPASGSTPYVLVRFSATTAAPAGVRRSPHERHTTRPRPGSARRADASRAR
jgi:hypothetical protein